ncbi:MAG: hypothetical protein V4727_00095 [Verrucomicrobiota bacterium]
MIYHKRKQRFPRLSQVALFASLILVLPCNAEDANVAKAGEQNKTAHFAIQITKETFHEMLVSLPETKISPNREKIIEDLVRKIGQNAPEIAADKQAGIAAEIYKKTVLPLLTPQIEQFNSLMVSAASKDKVSAGFLTFQGLAEGMAEDKEMSGIIVYARYTPNKGGSENPYIWDWNSNLTGGTDSTRYASAKIDEKPTIELKPYGSDKSFDFPISCNGKVTLKKEYRKNYYFTEKPAGKAKTSISLIPEVDLTASKSIENNYLQFFTVEGEESRSISKTIKYDASLVFDFDANPKGK